MDLGMIKLKNILNEVYKHPIFGSDKSYWTVVKPIDVLVITSEYERTSRSYQSGGRHSRLYKNKPIKMKMSPGIQISNLPGGLFAIDYKPIYLITITLMISLFLLIKKLDNHLFISYIKK